MPMNTTRPGYTIVVVDILGRAQAHFLDGRHIEPLTLVRVHRDFGWGVRCLQEAENLALSILGDHLLRSGDFTDVFQLTPAFAQFALLGRREPSFFIEDELVAAWATAQRRATQADAA
jgi:hypothetical protein